ncbi:MAG: SEC-C domain-containing protein, partial [Caldilineaceae bacterium]|nr:SEC-C domain-containing protein [Caldilineaceae bacterium]
MRGRTRNAERAFACIRRNDACPCASGHKFKQCHGPMQGKSKYGQI